MANYKQFYNSWKTFLTEAEKKFDPYMAAYKRLSDKDKEDEHIQAMLNAGYVPIQRISKTSDTGLSALLGSGAYGEVYEAVDKQGRRMAVKVFDDVKDGEEEAAIRKKIKDRVDSIGNNDPAKKHVVNFDKMMNVDGETPIDKKYIISLEMLRPMTTTERDSLYKGMESLSPEFDPLTLYYRMFKLYPNNIVATVRKYMDRKYSSEAYTKYLKSFLTSDVSERAINLYILKQINDLRENILSAMKADTNINTDKIDVKIKQFSDLMADMISDNIIHDQRFNTFDEKGKKISKMFLPNVEQENAIKMLFQYITDVIYRALENAIINKASQVDHYNANIENYKKFKSDYEFDKKEPTEEQYALMDKKVQEFVKAMYHLAKTHKVYWGDLHKKNIMINPRTGDYVASDLGLFDII